MTTYRLRDRKLQQKLDELSHGAFSEMLKTMGRFLVEKPATNIQLAESRFTVTLFKEDFEVEPEYDPNDWNVFPDVTPPEGVLMRVEIEYPDGDVSRACSIFKDEVWWEAVNGEPIDEEVTLIGKVKRFRPWE